MEEQQLSSEDVQQIWNEEAARLDAGEDSPALEETAPAAQDAPQEDVPVQTSADPWATLPEEFKAKLAKIDQLEYANAQLLHHVRSAEGRVASMQREFQQARQAATQVAEAPSQGQMSAAVRNPEKWEQLKQDFPEWAGAMEEYVAAKLSSVQPQQVQQSLDPHAVAAFVHQQVAQTRADMARALEEARIEGKYDNWKQIVNTTDFVQWFSVQPQEVRSLADSSASKDALRMLDLFHDAKKRSASDIRSERNQRLSAAATTRPGQSPPPQTLEDMTPQELWNYEARKREKDRAARGF